MSSADSKTRVVRRNTDYDVSRLISWLPVDAIVEDGRPAIEWMNMAGIELAEPFFSQTVETVRKNGKDDSVITELDALIQLEKISDSLKPSGFIFHASRSGSTLVANACRALKNSIVIAEAHAIDKLVSRFFTDTDLDGTKELLYSFLLRGAVSAMGQKRFGSERHYFIKFAPASTLQFARIRRIWPNVPAVFLFRHPLEVMVSNMALVPEWMGVESNSATAAAIVGVDQNQLTGMGHEEFCARALGRYYSAAEANAGKQTLLLNYNELTPEALLEIVGFFGVEPSAGEAAAIIQSASYYSKDPAKEAPFHHDGDSKMAQASTHLKEVAEEWAMPSYRRLLTLPRPGATS